MRLLSTVALATLLLTTATAQAFEVKAYTGTPGKASLEDLSPTPDAPGDGTFEESERLVKQAWERHVVAIRERTDRCEPPAAAWLAQFPLPKTP